jgi:hypothetical protein
VHSALLFALEKRLGLGLAARGVAAGGPGYPAISLGVSGDRERALRWQREEVSPGRGEIGVGWGSIGRTAQKQQRRPGGGNLSPKCRSRKKSGRDGSTRIDPSRPGKNNVPI